LVLAWASTRPLVLQAPVPCRCGRAEVVPFLTEVKNGEFDDLCPGVSRTVMALPGRHRKWCPGGAGMQWYRAMCTPRCRSHGAVVLWW